MESNGEVRKMNNKGLNLILKEGEGYNIEFKQQVDKSLPKELVAFSNSSGGKILIGVNDDGEKKGIKITNKLKSAVLSTARNCDPSITPKLKTINNILIVEVSEGKQKPYQCKDGFFIRVGASTQKMKRDEILKFVVTESLVHFGKKINRKFDIKKDFDRKKFDKFLGLSNISIPGKNWKHILTNLGIGTHENRKFFINNAGILMFAKKPNKFFRHSFITCVLYKGKDKTKIIDRKDYYDDLISNYHNTITFLQRHLNLEYIIKGTGPRKELFEIPEESLKESVLNSLIHRDYYDQRVGIFVEIFDDRVEITNKGKLLFDKKDFGKISFPRNPLLFDLFYRVDFIEKVGSGITRIKNACKDRNIRVKFDTRDFFRVTFYRKAPPEKPPKKPPKKQNLLTELESKILSIIEQDNKITQLKIAEKLSIKPDTVKEYIQRLKKKKALKREGSPRGGWWKVLGR
jgi:ATP-dependent DNA helicase RecG